MRRTRAAFLETLPASLVVYDRQPPQIWIERPCGVSVDHPFRLLSGIEGSTIWGRSDCHSATVTGEMPGGLSATLPPSSLNPTAWQQPLSEHVSRSVPAPVQWLRKFSSGNVRDRLTFTWSGYRPTE